MTQLLRPCYSRVSVHVQYVVIAADSLFSGLGLPPNVMNADIARVRLPLGVSTQGSPLQTHRGT